MADAGLPAPDLQVDIRDADGVWLARTDFLWEFAVVGEADGLEKYDDLSVLRAEKLRQERLERAGLVVVRWTMNDVFAPGGLERLIGDAIARGARRSADERRWRLASVA